MKNNNAVLSRARARARIAVRTFGMQKFPEAFTSVHVMRLVNSFLLISLSRYVALVNQECAFHARQLFARRERSARKYRDLAEMLKRR